MDVQASHVVLLLVSLPEHVELLLGLIVLPDDGSELIDLLVPLLDALVVVPKLVLEAAREVLKVRVDLLHALLMGLLEDFKLCLVFFFLVLDGFLDLGQVLALLLEAARVAHLLDLLSTRDHPVGVRAKTLLVLLDPLGTILIMPPDAFFDGHELLLYLLFFHLHTCLLYTSDAADE